MSAEATNNTFRENIRVEIKKIQEELNELKKVNQGIVDKSSKKPAKKSTTKEESIKRKPVKRKPVRKVTKSRKS